MAETLYTREILRLAMGLGDDAPLSQIDGQADIRSPVCGSEVKLAIILNDDGGIAEVSIAANACAVGQAAAVILKRHAAGLTQDGAAHMRGAIAHYLSGDGAMPGEWEELSALMPARDYPARHSAVLLPFDALIAAFIDAQKRKAA